MTFQSELVSPITHESGEGSGRVEPEGQVMAADDDDNMECADYEEQIQHPKSDEDEGNAEYEFPELEMGLDFRKSESISDEVASQEYESEVWRAKRRSPRRSADGTICSAMPTTIQDVPSA